MTSKIVEQGLNSGDALVVVCDLVWRIRSCREG